MKQGSPLLPAKTADGNLVVRAQSADHDDPRTATLVPLRVGGAMLAASAKWIAGSQWFCHAG